MHMSDLGKDTREIREDLDTLRSFTVQTSRCRNSDGVMETHYTVIQGGSSSQWICQKPYHTFTYEPGRIESEREAVLAYLEEVYSLLIFVSPRKYAQAITNGYRGSDATPLWLSEFTNESGVLDLCLATNELLQQYCLFEARSFSGFSSPNRLRSRLKELAHTEEPCFVYCEADTVGSIEGGIAGASINGGVSAYGNVILPIILNAKLSFDRVIGEEEKAIFLAYGDEEWDDEDGEWDDEDEETKKVEISNADRTVRQCFSTFTNLAIVHAPGEVVDWTSIGNLYRQVKNLQIKNKALSEEFEDKVPF